MVAVATRIRKDFKDVVFLNGQPYTGGDKVPDGVRVGGHLTEDGKDHGPAPEQPAQSGDSTDQQAPEVQELTAEEREQALALGVPKDVVDSVDRYGRVVVEAATNVREQVEAEARAKAAAGTSFNPAEKDAPEVNAYLEEHPDEALAVLALEATGKARKTILGAHLADD